MMGVTISIAYALAYGVHNKKKKVMDTPLPDCINLARLWKVHAHENINNKTTTTKEDNRLKPVINAGHVAFNTHQIIIMYLHEGALRMLPPVTDE